MAFDEVAFDEKSFDKAALDLADSIKRLSIK
jgi:hypothetical protein